LLNIYLLFGTQDIGYKFDGVALLLSEKQLTCIKNRSFNPLTPISVKDLYGPESFDELQIAYFDNSNNLNSFEYDFSNCFYDRIIPDVSINNLDTALGLATLDIESEYYFFKSSGTEIVSIYVKR